MGGTTFLKLDAWWQVHSLKTKVIDASGQRPGVHYGSECFREYVIGHTIVADANSCLLVVGCEWWMDEEAPFVCLALWA